MATDTSSPAAAARPEVGAAAAALAALNAEPIPSISAATDASICGSAMTYDIGPTLSRLKDVDPVSVRGSRNPVRRLRQALLPNVGTLEHEGISRACSACADGGRLSRAARRAGGRRRPRGC